MDFIPGESFEKVGRLRVFAVSRTERMGQKTRHPARDDLFSGSLYSFPPEIDGFRIS